MTEKKIDKTIRFNSEIQSLEKINPMFSKATIRVLYKYFNRNGSYLTDSSIEKAIPSIYNIPIVGEYLEHADNFGGHGTGIEITDQGMKLIQNTIPYGVVPESANLYWEDVTEKDGTINSYLVVEGAYLWTGRYEELNGLLENSYGQSMEIDIVNGNYAVIDGIETFKIDEFIFSALCILGIDKEGTGHVEPAFESANITTYSLDKEDFKKQFNQMIAELKFSMKQGGSNDMPTENEEKVVKDYEKTEVEFDQVDETESTESDTTEVEDVENAETTEEEIIVSPSDNPDSSTEASDTFEDDSPAESTEKVTDLDEEAEKDKDQTVKEDEQKVDYEAKFNEAQSDLDSLKKDYTSLKSQLAELQSYKRQREEDDLKAKFEGKLSDEEFTQVFAEYKEDSLEKVEEKLFALIGKKNFSIQSTETKDRVNKIKITPPKEKEYDPYGGIFD